MIDLHCHILPALDDGAFDLADSVAMAREAERDGITVVCATPHIRDDHDVRIEELASRVSAVQDELDGRGVAVRIAGGGEVAQPAADGLSDAHLRDVSLDGCGWILLEPAPGLIGDELASLVERLRQRAAGVIVAHPERHARAGLVHLLASDAHSSHGGRSLRLSPARERLRDVCSPAQLEWITERAPAAILRGEPVSAPW